MHRHSLTVFDPFDGLQDFDRLATVAYDVSALVLRVVAGEHPDDGVSHSLEEMVHHNPVHVVHHLLKMTNLSTETFVASEVVVESEVVVGSAHYAEAQLLGFDSFQVDVVEFVDMTMAVVLVAAVVSPADGKIVQFVSAQHDALEAPLEDVMKTIFETLSIETGFEDESAAR